MSTRSEKTVYAFVGGGSGGHLTPLIPVAQALKKLNPASDIIHIGQKGDRLNSIITSTNIFSAQKKVHAGKFRRYNGESWLKRVFDIKTFLFNARDGFYFVFGIVESWFLLGKMKPTVIFMKGGYVCAPVGIAAGLRNIPYITHDSDAMVSLAHRIIAKKATKHLTAMEPSYYEPQYNSSKTVQVGVPVRAEYRLITVAERQVARKELGIDTDAKVVLAVGGGLGAKNINDAIVEGTPTLLADENAHVILITGHKLYDDVKRRLASLPVDMNNRIIIEPFSNKLHMFSAAANVVVTRAGATNIAEFSAQGCVCIIVPNPLLAGGHQLKNAKAFEKNGAVVVIEEENAKHKLAPAINALLQDESAQENLSKSLYAMSSIDAADKIARILFDMSKDLKET